MAQTLEKPRSLGSELDGIRAKVEGGIRLTMEDGERLYLEVAPEQIERLPVAWTSLRPPDPWIDVAAGRSLFRVEDLLRLVDLIASVGAEASDAV